MVKTTRVLETVSVTMIWQYVDSLYVNRVLAGLRINYLPKYTNTRINMKHASAKV